MAQLTELVLTPGERARGLRTDDVVFSMDWSGEEHPGQLAEFVAGRVRAFGIPPEGVGAALPRPAGADADPPRRGDVPVRQLDHLAGALVPLGCALLTRDDGTDTYAILVARTADPEPGGLTHRGLPVRAWTARAGETLVSLDCPDCSSLLVWELPAGETPAGEHCDCGTPLFDADGRPLPRVTLHD
ncbi:hypothetical protein [Streptomyces sp. SID8352]|uniref:hypothetical protein n=1 Tax=Streptomyces sp. SID8352 TaxID=2690338 RepID=UPI0013697F07|nr:hypothetical protein [Streptomyces sp. SID8352]MYU23231.1 hypothetical protein [Streptomyces sp. SID8352]